VNRLAEETSPYLRQHAENPVDWYPWGDEAFARAREEDRPVLLSVGYSACHWCHVMAHESFEDAETAALMNERFVSIKVDREERPDVDAIYMDAVQAMTGQGGWPMTVFLMPDGRPFYGGTYFPKVGRGGMITFTELLSRIDELWRTRRDDLDAQADELTEAIGQGATLEPRDEDPTPVALTEAYAGLAAAFDAEHGGFGGAPKFPQTMSLDLLLRAHAHNGSAETLAMVTASLDAMAAGGIYDHLGGGFARYSVDREWQVPHFEKMLYDQALLTRVYLHAWLVTGKADYRQVVDETVGYVLRDLRHPLGGFSSAEDADSPAGHGHNVEGLFATWTPSEIRDVLGDGPTTDAVLAWWDVTEVGNFDGRSILHRPVRGELIRPAEIEAARRSLFEAREHRPRPGLDDKVLTEWNGLMLAALAEGAAATGNTAWRDAARVTGEFLLEHLRDDDGRWQRSWQAERGDSSAGRTRHLAYAADYAALIDAFTRLGEATGEARWIGEARAVADGLLDLFWDDERGGVFTTGRDAEALVTRPKDLLDNATPSANSLAAVGLLRLAALTGETRYEDHAAAILRLLGQAGARHPTALGHLLAALDLITSGATEIAIVGARPDLVAAVTERYLPNAVLAWGEPYDSPLWASRDAGPDGAGQAYVCRNFTCQSPVGSVDALVAQLTA
jgi:uncharacterized protein YyaL (SSP411 family)